MIKIRLDVTRKIVIGAAALIDQYDSIGPVYSRWTLRQRPHTLQSACKQSND